MSSETYESCRADAYDEEQMEKRSYEGTIKCQECGDTQTVRLSNYDDDLYYGPFECENEDCTCSDWEIA